MIDFRWSPSSDRASRSSIERKLGSVLGENGAGEARQRCANQASLDGPTELAFAPFGISSESSTYKLLPANMPWIRRLSPLRRNSAPSGPDLPLARKASSFKLVVPASSTSSGPGMADDGANWPSGMGSSLHQQNPLERRIAFFTPRSRSPAPTQQTLSRPN